MSKNALLSEQVRNRLAELSYEEDITESDITKVIKEELNIKEIPPFTLYKSSEMNIGKYSGFDGKIIHFKENKELYFFARGTEPKEYNDVMYDVAGIAAGGNAKQLNDAEDMYNEVINKIVPKELDKKEATNFIENMNIYGDGHSLGGHIAVSLSLKMKTFDDVRGLNDAPVNVYQMVQYDKVFQDHLIKQYGSNFKTKLKEEDLQKEVYSYYSNEIAKVEHIRVKGEPLYSQKFKGSLYVGNITVLGDKSTPDFPDITQMDFGIRGLDVLNKAQEMIYNQSILQVIGGFQELDDQLGTEKGKATVDRIVTNLKNGEYWAAGLEGGNLIDLSNQLQLGLSSLLMAPKPVAEKAVAIFQHRHQFENHSISMLIQLFNANSKESYFNFVDTSTGKTVLLKQESIKNFITKCNEALEKKKLAITKFNSFIEAIGDAIFEDDKESLLKLMTEKEWNPSIFYNETKGFWMSLLNGTMIVVDSVVFDKEIRDLDHEVFDSLFEAREIIKNEIDHLEGFIEKTLKLGKVAFEKDAELGSLIRRMGV